MGKSMLTIRTALVAAGLASMVATTGLAVAQDKPHPPAAGAVGGALPAPRIIVVDRSAIFVASKVGQDIVRQVNGLTQTRRDTIPCRKRRTGEGVADASAADRHSRARRARQKSGLFNRRKLHSKQKVQTRQDQIQGGLLKARQQVEQALAPILQGIMQERGANLLLDRAAVVLGMVDVDVTRVTIQRLDRSCRPSRCNWSIRRPGLRSKCAELSRGRSRAVSRGHG